MLAQMCSLNVGEIHYRRFFGIVVSCFVGIIVFLIAPGGINAQHGTENAKNSETHILDQPIHKSIFLYSRIPNFLWNVICELQGNLKFSKTLYFFQRMKKAHSNFWCLLSNISRKKIDSNITKNNTQRRCERSETFKVFSTLFYICLLRFWFRMRQKKNILTVFKAFVTHSQNITHGKKY
jgi:hypothetical protein